MKFIALMVSTVSRIVTGMPRSRPRLNVPLPRQRDERELHAALDDHQPPASTWPASLVTESSSYRSSIRPTAQITAPGR